MAGRYAGVAQQDMWNEMVDSLDDTALRELAKATTVAWNKDLTGPTDRVMQDICVSHNHAITEKCALANIRG